MTAVWSQADSWLNILEAHSICTELVLGLVVSWGTHLGPLSFLSCWLVEEPSDMWYLPLLASAHPYRPVFLLPALEAGLLGCCGLAAHVTHQARESQGDPSRGF